MLHCYKIQEHTIHVANSRFARDAIMAAGELESELDRTTWVMTIRIIITVDGMETTSTF